MVTFKDWPEEHFAFLFNHIFLPPKLPHQAETGVEEKNTTLAIVVLECAKEYSKKCGGENYQWMHIENMLQNMVKLQSHDSFDAQAFRWAWNGMTEGSILAFHINAQNCGLIIRRTKKKFIFQAFEASPLARAVIACKGKLRCSFPGPAIEIDLDIATDELFLKELSIFLEKAHVDNVDLAAEMSAKGAGELAEARETVSPKLFTELLVGILRGIGRPSPIHRIEKRIADDVLWENADLPWRRSPLWLVIRVALQTNLTTENQCSPTEYKSFTIFLMAKILEKGALTRNCPSDILYMMNAKVSRRVYKLPGDSLPEWLREDTQRIGDETSQLLRRRWTTEQNYHSKPHDWRPEVFEDHENIRNQLRLSLTDSKGYIDDARSFNSMREARKPFKPPTVNRLELDFITISEIPRPVSKGNPTVTEKDLAMADFETWIRVYLARWIERNEGSENSCLHLKARMEEYVTMAKQSYKGNPERMSVFFLTMMEMWIALDTIALQIHPMLSEYDPGFTDGFLNALLLPLPDQRTRLRAVEEYISKRRAGCASAPVPTESVFSSTVNARSFCIRYYKSSEEMQKLEKDIQQRANEQRDAKKEELAAMLAAYEDLITSAQSRECEYHVHPVTAVVTHMRRCQKCVFNEDASKMRIQVFEWPLPGDELSRFAVIFELRCPPSFAVWREVTYRTLVEVSQRIVVPEGRLEKPEDDVESYSGLQRYYRSPFELAGVSQQKGVLRWASSVKSYLKSHYRLAHLPTTLAKISVKNPLRYRLYDSNPESGRWLDGSFGPMDVTSSCTPIISLASHYSRLNYALSSTEHSTNSVLARQAECPHTMQLNEYLAFGFLRAGHRLQWMNILRELRSRTLSFGDPVVNMLFTQAAWQVGPTGKSSKLRDSHTELANSTFGHSLAHELEQFLQSIESNWQEIGAVHTLIIIGIQLASYAKDSVVVERALSFIRQARAVCVRWIQDLSHKLNEFRHTGAKELQARLVQVAAVCRETFNVGFRKVRGIYNNEFQSPPGLIDKLLNSREDLAVVALCAITIQGNSPTNFLAISATVRMMLDRDRRIAHALEPDIRALIMEKEVPLDLTMIWPSYNISTWKESPHDRMWLVCYPRAGTTSMQEVHYNIITGKLLVDGVPLGRMPTEYTNHPTYIDLFGERLLNVFPSSMAGMIFQARHVMNCPFEVSFAMRDTELIIRTRHSQKSSIHQLIPRSKLKSDFPDHITKDKIAWLDIATGEIEFRFKNNPWIFKDIWRTKYHRYPVPHQTLYRFKFQHISLLDIRSSVACMITACLSPLEYPEYIHIEYDQRKNLITARLTRLKLDFEVLKGDLICRQFPDMRVALDGERSFGAFTGLENRLVVRQGRTYSVIVPHGTVAIQRNERFHVNVQIDTRKYERVKYHLYTIDDTLGRLVGNGTLLSHLYKIYLHAVTASCLPDKLTRRTGTEEALYLLRSAATWSFRSLDPDEAEIFNWIAQLSPVRTYYPIHLQFMQKVVWKDGLWPIAQHDEFQRIVEDVSTHHVRFSMFESVGSLQSKQRLPRMHSDAHLCRRAMIRNSSIRTEDPHDRGGDGNSDNYYESRDGSSGSNAESRVHYITSLVRSWPAKLPVLTDLFVNLSQWNIIGDPAADLSMGFGYDQRWLEPNFPQIWFHLLLHLGDCQKEKHLYSLMFLFATMTYGGKIKLEFIGTLLAFATAPGLQKYKMDPDGIYRTYELSRGFEPDKTALINLWVADDCVIDYNSSAESELPSRAGEDQSKLLQRRALTFDMNKTMQLQQLAMGFIKQWPRIRLTIPSGEYPLLRLEVALQLTKVMFRQWVQNMAFKVELEFMEVELRDINKDGDNLFPVSSFNTCKNRHTADSSEVKIDDLFQYRPPPLPPIPSTEYFELHSKLLQDATPTAIAEFFQLLQDFKGHHSKPFEKRYTDKLEESYRALHNTPHFKKDDVVHDYTMRVIRFHNACKKFVDTTFEEIKQALTPRLDDRGWMCYQAGQWPRISPISLLQRLASNAATNTSPEWRKTLLIYAKGITRLQWSLRLLKLNRKDTKNEGINADLMRELANPGHQRWDPSDSPDWLLMEIENNLLIRPVQADIARVMISPPNGQNSIMQLCMGEGKTSVIVPIVSATLADRKKLVRVVVLKPLSNQMFQMLVKRLGGLLNRRIFFMPFSRGIKMGPEEVKQIKSLFEDCMRHGGILLVQPEHILSFKLLGLERFYDAEFKSRSAFARNTAIELIKLQNWLTEYSRDILDESDEILSTKHELIYTLGTSKPIEHHPLRWMIVQEVLDKIRKSFKRIGATTDFEIEPMPHSGGFDHMRILTPSSGQHRLRQVAIDYIKEGTRAVHFRFSSDAERENAIKFITEPQLKWQDSEAFLGEYRDNLPVKNTLLLLRGLFAHKIILFCLHEKRWKVDYGLDLTRSLLAVPYRAKDSPSGKSEFSHPDVAITLTCLSYYYGGLTEDNLQLCFRNLYKSENPTMEYERWVDGVLLDSPKFKHLNSINLEDKEQWANYIVPMFQFNKAVIDFYLNTKVFPLEAKEFESKLSSSGWDISEKKLHPTTGFSGTNDNRYFLPLMIEQVDTPEQLNTNARVLSYLLQPENQYMPIISTEGKRLDIKTLLTRIADARTQKEDIQVLLDVGAQVLEWKNEEVAVNWLKMMSHREEIRAAVYFDDNDELRVVTRDGIKEPLRVSAFAEQLDGCLVYLDELHTRGTDLKLPRKSKAALTLGPALTKDRLVQACMRMRKLGAGHSILFCGPPEIDRKIKKVAQRDGRDSIQVRDVLYWCMQETCTNTRKYIPIWAKQGISYQFRSNAVIGTGEAQPFPVALLEKESKTLEEHYGIGRNKGHVMPASIKSLPMLKDIKDRCEEFGVSTFAGAPMLEEQEQERELSHEIEAQRETHRPPRVDAVKSIISNGVEEFIRAGKIQRLHLSEFSFIPAFNTLRQTSARNAYSSNGWSDRLVVSRDFANVIVTTRDTHMDHFLRPVHWVLSSVTTPNLLVVLSPYEVNLLLPKIRISRAVTLHMYNARMAKASATYEGLNVYTIPSQPSLPSLSSSSSQSPSASPNGSLSINIKPIIIDQLNLFAGQLYFKDYASYKRLTYFLGLWLDEKPYGVKVEIDTLDGFVKDVAGRKVLGMVMDEDGEFEGQGEVCSPFERSVVGVLRELVGFRRKGQGYIGTHVGRVLHGRNMLEEDF